VHLAFVQGGHFSPIIDLSKAKVEHVEKTNLRNTHTQRLSRQLRQISNAAASMAGPAPHKNSQEGVFFFGDLDRLIKASKPMAFQWKKVDRGLLIGALRFSGARRLSERLLPDRKFREGKIFEGAQNAVLTISDRELADNSLVISSLGVGERGLPGLLRGTVPIFWWPLKTENLMDLVFSNIMVVSFYNPAHLWESLRKRGYELNIDRGQIVTASKRDGNRVAQLKNFRMLQVLITNFLMSEDNVLAMIDAVERVPAPRDVPTEIQIDAQIHF
jgi:hypothetical protein